jgi:hypothetical protein
MFYNDSKPSPNALISCAEGAGAIRPLAMSMVRKR